MKTLKECIESQKCRTGKAAGTTKHGAFWLVCEPIKIRSFGGDGVGNSRPDERVSLELRHYRSGEVKAVAHYSRWHQNGGDRDSYRSLDILGCATAEQVIVALKGSRVSDDYSDIAVYSDYYAAELTAQLTSLGLAECEPAPDETAV